jgi:hypothetical protein
MSLRRAVPRMQATIEAAMEFGLTEVEVWDTAFRVLSAIDADATLGEYEDRLAAALAQRILARRRDALMSRRAA